MTQDLMQTAIVLADTLAEENLALVELDFGRAAMLLGAKFRAAEAFTAAEAATAPEAMRTRRSLFFDVAARLRELAEENRRLLERAVFVQGRVIGAVVKAVPKATGGVPRYGAGGAMSEGRRVRPMAFSARA